MRRNLFFTRVGKWKGLCIEDSRQLDNPDLLHMKSFPKLGRNNLVCPTRICSQSCWIKARTIRRRRANFTLCQEQGWREKGIMSYVSIYVQLALLDSAGKQVHNWIGSLCEYTIKLNIYYISFAYIIKFFHTIPFPGWCDRKKSNFMPRQNKIFSFFLKKNKKNLKSIFKDVKINVQFDIQCRVFVDSWKSLREVFRKNLQ